MKAILIFLFVSFMGTPARGEDRILGFHWGSPDSNATLLSLAGEGGKLSPAAMEKLKTWYDDSGRSDAAGMGLYFSTSAHDSRGFGNDLLIVEISREDPRTMPIRHARAHDLKDLSNAALDVGGGKNTLPIVTHYGLANWHVISRLPNDSEAGIRIVIRPPRESDAKQYYQTIKKGRTPGEALRELAAHIGALKDTPEKPLFDSGRKFLEQLLLHEAYPDVLSFDFSKDPDTLAQMVELYRMAVPRVAGTQLLVEKWLKIKLAEPPAPSKWHSPIWRDKPAPAFSQNELRLLTEIFPGFAEAQREEFAAKLLERLNHRDGPVAFNEVTTLVMELSHSMRPGNPRTQELLAKWLKIKLSADPPRARWSDWFWKLRTQPMFGPKELRLLAAALPDFPEAQKQGLVPKLLERLTSREIAVAHDDVAILYDTAIPFLSQSDHQRLRAEMQKSLDEPGFHMALTETNLIRASKLWGPRDLARAIGRSFGNEASRWPPFSKAEANGFHTRVAEVVRLLDSQGVEAKHAFLIETLGALRNGKHFNPFPPDVIIPLLRHAFASGEKVEKEWLDAVRAVLEKDPRLLALREMNALCLLDEGMNHGEFEVFVSRVAKEFPKFRRPLVQELQYARHRIKSELFVSRVIGALEEASLSGNIRDHVDENFETLRSYPWTQWLLLGSYRRDNERVLRNITDSHPYSKLSRIFLLVDPILVSEDLRGVWQANQPQLRFNEGYERDGQTVVQPTWENFQAAWQKFAHDKWTWTRMRGSLPDQHYVIYGATEGLVDSIGRARAQLMFNNVDGTPTESLLTLGGRSEEKTFGVWDRKKYQTLFPVLEYERFEGPQHEAELSRYFDIETSPHGKVFRFKSIAELRPQFPSLDRYLRYSTGDPPRAMPESKAIVFLITEEVLKIKDPLDRAAAILDLVPKLHPFENGNGRFARFWAAMELVQAGFAMPVGFPTNDFLMTRERLRLEVRKSVKLGELWQKMLVEAKQSGVAPEAFFQSRFRGSALEGIMHVAPAKNEELRRWVEWLEKQSSAPEWGKDLLRVIEKRMAELRDQNGALSEVGEVKLAGMIDAAWREHFSTSPVLCTFAKIK